MKPNLISIFLLMLMCNTVYSQNHKAVIKQTAAIYVNAFLQNDIPKTVEYTYPKYVEAHGGKDSLIRAIENDNKNNKTQSIKLKDIVLDEPYDEVQYGTSVFSIIPDSLAFQLGGAIYSMRSALLAISTDNGKNWSFSATADLKWLISVQPEIAKLNIPPTTSPRLVMLNPNENPTAQPGGKTTKITYKLIGKRLIALVVVTHHKEYLADTASIKLINNKWIKSYVLGAFNPHPSDTVRYGPNAINGVNKYIIDDEHYPKAYLQFITQMQYIGLTDQNATESK